MPHEEAWLILQQAVGRDHRSSPQYPPPTAVAGPSRSFSPRPSKSPQSGEAKSDTFTLSSIGSGMRQVLCLKSPEGCLEEETQSWVLENEC